MKKQQGRFLSFEERLVIERMLKEGNSQADVARTLNRNRSTISKEIKSNTHPYDAQAAQNRLRRRC